MSSAAQPFAALVRARFIESLDGCRELLRQATPESLEQAVRRLEALRQQLSTAGAEGSVLASAGDEANRVLGSLGRLRECALRGDQMVSGRLQLLHGAELLYDRNARPPSDHFGSRVQLEG